MTREKQFIPDYSQISLSWLYIPLGVILNIIAFLFFNNALSTTGYTEIQKDLFFCLNSHLSQHPLLEHNLTQLGDALVFLSLLSVLSLFAPKIWETLLSASVLSLIFSGTLKNIFDVPRPATIYGEGAFTVIGKTIVGYSSCPSGHSITIFVTLMVLAFSFMPTKYTHRWLYFIILILLGLFCAFTRVGVGAHHPLDVVSGSSIGCISAILGIVINKKFSVWKWISNPKFYPIFIFLFCVCFALLILDILRNNLIIFYFSLLSLAISVSIMTKKYVQFIKK